MKKIMSYLNPFYKAISLILFSIILSFNYNPAINTVVFITTIIIIILFTNVQYKKMFILLLIISISAVSLYMTGVLFTTGEDTQYTISLVSNMKITSSYNGLQLATRVYAFGAIGMLFIFSNDSLQFVYSLQQQGHLKPKFAYGTLAAFHLLPNIKEEFEHAKFALHARGMSGIQFYFKVVFAMMVNAIKWAQCLSIAMISKGFDVDGKRTNYYTLKVTIYDWMFLVVPNILLLMILIL